MFFESEFGLVPKNSGLNLWRLQFWGTLAWIPSPSQRPLPPPQKKKTTAGSEHIMQLFISAILELDSFVRLCAETLTGTTKHS